MVHVQSCRFANLTYSFFDVSIAVAVVVAFFKLPIKAKMTFSYFVVVVVIICTQFSSPKLIFDCFYFLVERLLSAIEYASKNSTSLNAVNDLLGSCFAVLLEACHGVADKFVLSDDVVTALADFKRCERERYDLLKKTEMDSAEEKRKAGEDLLGLIHIIAFIKKY